FGKVNRKCSGEGDPIVRLEGRCPLAQRHRGNVRKSSSDLRVVESHVHRERDFRLSIRCQEETILQRETRIKSNTDRQSEIRIDSDLEISRGIELQPSD